MNAKIWAGLLVVVSGCGEVTAEPIRSESFAISSVDVDHTESDDAYACDVIDLGAQPSAELQPFVRLGAALVYAGQCRHAEPGGPNQCWYTGPSDCGAGSTSCGGFEGAFDTASGSYRVTGGQHMLCAYPCVRDDQCPAPSSGTARASCMLPAEFDPATDGGSCMLGCADGETCPDGFLCIAPGLAFTRSDGTTVPAPKQCVQYKALSAQGDPVPQ